MTTNVIVLGVLYGILCVIFKYAEKNEKHEEQQ